MGKATESRIRRVKIVGSTFPSANDYLQTPVGKWRRKDHYGHDSVQMSDELRHIPIAKEICNNYHFKTLDKVIYRYKDGLYVPDGEALIEKEAQGLLGSKASSYTVNEVIKWIARETRAQRTEFDRDLNIINTLSGLLNIETSQLEKMPDYPSLTQIPVFYEDCDCPLIRRFLNEVLKPEDIPVVEELFGYCLFRQYPIQRAFLLVGEGSNGKSTLIELLRDFLGKENCSSLTFQELEEDRFARADLFMKLANLSADIPSKAMHHVGLFKMLTGGDEISADRKFKDRVKFVNFAKLVFSTNRPPKVYNEDSYAFWRRWIIIDFPNQFKDNADTHLLSKLTTPNEKSGLLNLSIKGLKRLLDKGDFSYGTSPDKVAERYNILADPVLSFANDCCELETDAITEKDSLYQAFATYCEERNISLVSKESFGRNLRNSPSLHVGTTRLREDGQRHYAWRGIKLRVS
ncbi:phage/plasmid primase, P4 family [Chloroflexota bacterium]